jgi:hypothetical protein
MASFLWGATQGAWTDAIAAASLSALANNSMAVGSAIDNTTTVNQLAEVSFISTTTGIAVVAGGHLAVYLLPLLHDGTSYPTNNAAGTSLPAITYCRGVIGVPNGTVVPAGSTVIQVPYGSWKLALVNRLGVALNTSTTALTLRYRLIVEASV